MPARLTTREAFLEALGHDEHVVLGRRLHPFCLDDWIVLDGLNSPLIHGGTISITDLNLALVACSSDSIADFIRTTRENNWRHRIWCYVAEGAPVDHLLPRFNRYVEDFFPAFSHVTSRGSSDFKVPGIYVCAGRLIAAGIAPAIVRRMALGEVCAWALAMNEAMGFPSETLMSDQDIMELADMERMGIL